MVIFRGTKRKHLSEQEIVKSFIISFAALAYGDVLAQVPEVWDFEIFIAGETPKAKLAYDNLRNICSQYLANNCKITIFDICKNPKLARENQIMAIPTIIRKSPLPKRTLIGDLSDLNLAVSKLELSKPQF